MRHTTAKHIHLHTHDFSAGALSSKEIVTNKPVIYLLYSMTLVLTADNWAGASYVADGIKRILRGIQGILGDEPRYQYGQDAARLSGGIMLEGINRNWQGYKPQFLEPPTALVNHEVKMSWIVPVGLPPSRYGEDFLARSALRVGRKIEGQAEAASFIDRIKWGTLSDLFTGGTNVQIAAGSQIRVAALVDEGLDTKKFRSPSKSNRVMTGRELYRLFGIQLRSFMSVEDLGTVANPELVSVLAQSGNVLHIGNVIYNNGVRDETRISRLEYSEDNELTLMDLFLEEMLDVTAEESDADAGAGVPVGMPGFTFDKENTLSGFDARNSNGFTSKLNIGTGVAASEIGYQQVYTVPRPVKV